MSQRKRARVDLDSNGCGEEDSSSSCAHIQDLPDDLFQYCLEFVGKGNFYFVAPVSKFFYWNYISQGVQMKDNVLDVDVVLQQGRNKYTSTKVIGNGSIGQATHCFLNVPESIWNAVCREAAMNGRRDILECAEAIVEIDWSLAFDEGYGGFPTLEKVVANRDLNVINFLMKRKLTTFQDYKFAQRLLDNGQVLDVHWMINETIVDNVPPNFYEELAKHGHLDILKKDLLENKCELNYSHLLTAAEGGQVEVFKWLLGHVHCVWDEELSSKAAMGRSIPILELCVENNCPFDEGAYSAVMFGKKDEATTLHILKWLREHGVPWDEQTCEMTAVSGNIEALKWARNNGCPWDAGTFLAAVTGGDAKVLQYCFENGCPFDSSLYEKSVSQYIKGQEKTPDTQVNIFKSLHEHGVPWNKDASYAAAKFLPLPVLTWAVQNDCPWDDDIYRMAIIRSNISLLKYCIENNRGPANRNVYVDAIEYNYGGHTGVIQRLQLFREFNIPWDESVTDCAIRLQRLQVLCWLRCSGCPCRPDQQNRL